MNTNEKLQPITIDSIKNRIYEIRGQKVMLDRDLAELYQVETKVLNQAVKRNSKRFPDDFMFQLTNEELQEWKSQIVTSKSITMGLRKSPFAFTEQGLAMLSGLLNSEVAIQVNINIMRAFIEMRHTLSHITNHEHRIEKMELNIENLKLYIEDVLRDQNDINDDTATQQECNEKQNYPLHNKSFYVYQFNSSLYKAGSRSTLTSYCADVLGKPCCWTCESVSSQYDAADSSIFLPPKPTIKSWILLPSPVAPSFGISAAIRFFRSHKIISSAPILMLSCPIFQSLNLCRAQLLNCY